PASIPIRHGGTFASRDTIFVRATFSRSTIAPRASRPTRCSVFLPGSIPIVTIAVLNLRSMVWFLLLIATHDKHARWLGGSTAGPSHSEICLLHRGTSACRGNPEDICSD